MISFFFFRFFLTAAWRMASVFFSLSSFSINVNVDYCSVRMFFFFFLMNSSFFVFCCTLNWQL